MTKKKTPVIDYMENALKTYRYEDGDINVPAGVTDRFAAILGEYHVHSSSYTNYEGAKWKATLKNLIKKLKLAIKRNVATDIDHRDKIERHLVKLEEAANEYPKTESQLVAYLIFLSFELMGDLPNNRQRKNTHEKDFDLGRFRTLQYHQAPWQKARLVIHKARYGVPELFTKKEAEEIEEHCYGRHREAQEFLDWFKQKYPTQYAKVF